MLEAVFTLGSATLVLLLGLFVIYNSTADPTRRLFAGFCFAMFFWQATFYVSERISPWALTLNRLTFLGPVIGAMLFFLFIQRLNNSAGSGKRSSRVERNETIAVLVGFCAATLCFTPGVVSSISARFSSAGDFSGYDVTRGPLYGLYVLLFLVLVGFAFYGLLRLRKSNDPESAHRAKIIQRGVVLAALIGIAANIVLPLVLKTSEYSYLGSLAVLTIATFLTFAIAKHNLMNVQFFVARSFAYVLTIASILLIYIVAVLFLLRDIMGVKIGLVSEVVLGLVMLVTAIAFQPLKLRFDKVTNKIFYQVAYDSQELLDKLNRLLESTLDLNIILKKSSDIIAENIRAQYAIVGFLADGLSSRRLVSDDKVRSAHLDIEAMRQIAPHLRAAVTITDDLPLSQAKYKEILLRNNIAVLVRLGPQLPKAGKGLGYIVLGPKKSGNVYTGQDERVLGIVANELVLAMQNAMQFEEIQNFNITLQGKVDEATRKLRQTNEKLQGLDATKDEFITMASHQLRTPLTAVKGYLSMVLEGDAGKLNANQRRLLEQSYTSAQRMVYLIADLLNLSRLGTGKFVIEPTPTNLVDVVQTEIDQLAQTAASREVSLTFEHPDPFPEIMLDETKIHQVVMNFIDNAIYYTPPGGRVTVSLQETPGSIVYAVHDTGIGVPRREQRHLFTKFYRAENARQARPDGTGLGLFMAKKVVAAQGGAIIFESEESKGSTFGFRFNKRTHQVPGSKDQVSS